VAAAAAAPFAAQAQSMDSMGGDKMGRAKGPPTTIKVELGTAHLTDRAAETLEATIRRAVLDACAQSGVKGGALPGRLGPGIYGIIFRPELPPTGDVRR
jgi:hypothetical protein